MVMRQRIILLFNDVPVFWSISCLICAGSHWNQRVCEGFGDWGWLGKCNYCCGWDWSQHHNWLVWWLSQTAGAWDLQHHSCCHGVKSLMLAKTLCCCLLHLARPLLVGSSFPETVEAILAALSRITLNRLLILLYANRGKRQAKSKGKEGLLEFPWELSTLPTLNCALLNSL